MKIEDVIREINRLQVQIDELVKPEVGRWLDWTPTVDQGGAVTVTVSYARYIVTNEAVITVARLAVTGTGTASNPIIIGGQPVPIQAANRVVDKYNMIGSAVVFNSVGNVTYHVGLLATTTATDWRMIQDGSTNAVVGNLPSWALANGDIITFQAAYER